MFGEQHLHCQQHCMDSLFEQLVWKLDAILTDVDTAVLCWKNLTSLMMMLATLKAISSA